MCSSRLSPGQRDVRIKLIPVQAAATVHERPLTMSHIPKVFHDSMLHRLRDLEVVPERSSLVSDHDVLDLVLDCISLFHSQNRASDYGWKDVGWEVGACVKEMGWMAASEDELVLVRDLGQALLTCIPHLHKLQWKESLYEAVSRRPSKPFKGAGRTHPSAVIDDDRSFVRHDCVCLFSPPHAQG